MKNNTHRLTLVSFIILMLFACVGYLFALAHATAAVEATDSFKKLLYFGGAFIPLTVTTSILVSVWQELYRKPKPSTHSNS